MSPDRRKHRPSAESRGKDRVLHARIPEYLDEELRNQAGRLGLSVSTIVRNTLLHTFDLVGDIVRDSAQIARNLGYPIGSSAGAQTSETAAATTPVLAWQSGTLNVNGVCDKCNALLRKGTRAGIGVPARERPVFLCRDCLQEIETEASPPAADKKARSRRTPRPR